MSLMFFQDKVAKNNHLFSGEKDFQLSNRSQGRIQCLMTAVHCFGVRFMLWKRELSKTVAAPLIRQSIHQMITLAAAGNADDPLLRGQYMHRFKTKIE